MCFEKDINSFYDCLEVSWKYGHEKEWFWVSGILLVLVGSIGITGNILGVVVLYQPKFRRKVFYNLLIGLVCFDMLFILSYGAKFGYESLACQPTNELVSDIVFFVWNIGITGSIYMTVAISVKRYLGTCHPYFFHGRKLWLYVVPVVLISISYNFPKFVERRYYYINGTIHFNLPEKASSMSYKNAYNLWANGIVNLAVPLLMLALLNGAIIANIYRSNRRIGDCRSNEKANLKSTTKLLFCIVFIFVVSQGMRIIHKILKYHGKENEEFRRKVEVETPIKALILILNSSVNFIIYCLVVKSFRKEFRRVFGLQQQLPITTAAIATTRASNR